MYQALIESLKKDGWISDQNDMMKVQDDRVQIKVEFPFQETDPLTLYHRDFQQCQFTGYASTIEQLWQIIDCMRPNIKKVR